MDHTNKAVCAILSDFTVLFCYRVRMTVMGMKQQVIHFTLMTRRWET